MNVILLPYRFNNAQSIVLEDKVQVDHILNVLNLQQNDSLKIGFLSGKMGTATIANIIDDKIDGKDEAIQPANQSKDQKQRAKRLVLNNINCTLPPPNKLDLTVVLALPRPKVLRRLIMDMTAIGVNKIILVNSYRTDKSYWQSPMLKRLDEFVTEGLQQGGDTVPPIIELRKRFKPFVEDELPVLLADKRGVIAHPYANQSFVEYEHQYGQPQILCIGAEGGWIDYEVNLMLEQGCQAMSLGRRILRTEAAVNVLCGRYLQ